MQLGLDHFASTFLVIRHTWPNRKELVANGIVGLAANRWAGAKSGMLTGELLCWSTLLGGGMQYQKARREKNSNGIV